VIDDASHRVDEGIARPLLTQGGVAAGELGEVRAGLETKLACDRGDGPTGAHRPFTREQRHHPLGARQHGGPQQRMDLLAETTRSDQCHSLRVFGEEVRELHRDAAAERVADHRAPLEAEHCQQVAHPRRIGAQRVVAARLGGAAVTEQIGGDHCVALGQSGHHRPPGVRGGGDPVQQDDQWPLSGGLEVDLVAVELDVLVGTEGLAALRPAPGRFSRHDLRLPS
jgi:hypothetical protein